MIDSPVLVLNQNYQPLNVCNAKRALVLLGLGKFPLLHEEIPQVVAGVGVVGLDFDSAAEVGEGAAGFPLLG